MLAPESISEGKFYNTHGLIFFCLTVVLALTTVAFVIAFAVTISKNDGKNTYSYVYPPKDSILPVVESVYNEPSGAQAYVGTVDVANSPYYIPHDFYNGFESDTLILITHFKTYQQTSDYSCGAAAALMAFYYFGWENVTEYQLTCQMGVGTPEHPRPGNLMGAPTSSVYNIFAEYGWHVESSFDKNITRSFLEASQWMQDTLKGGHPIIVESLEWGPHWTVIIGYDTLGMEDTASHVLIMADPYDTTDHNQDGYYVTSFERFVTLWMDFDLLPEGQRSQQYVIPHPPSEGLEPSPIMENQWAFNWCEDAA